MKSPPYGPQNIGLGAPYRIPCGGWDDPLLVYIGDPNQHCNDNDNGKVPYANITKHGGVPIAPDTAPPSTDACSMGSGLVTVYLGGDNTYWNCYQATGGPVLNYSVCRKLGFKNLAAAKYWQGHAPFSGASTDACGGSSANQNHYRTRYATITETVDIPFCVNPITHEVGHTITVYTASQQYTVNQWSGKVTQDSCADSDMAHTARATGCMEMDYECGSWSGTGGTESEVLAAFLNGTPGATSVSQSVPASGAYSTTVSFTVVVSSTSPGTCGVDGMGNPIALPAITNTYDCTITFSNPYTASDLYADAATMLQGQMSAFTDDAVYQWRTDSSCYLAPLLTVDEATGGDIISSRDCGWTDTATNTGNVIGGFVPAGYAQFFNPTQKVYTDPTTWTGLYGQSSPDWCPHTKQWFDLSQGQWGAPGYWCSYNWQEPSLSNAVLFGGKLILNIWAETIMFVVPSHNFARPCGSIDAAAIDQPTATCTGSTLTGITRWPGTGNCPQPPTGGYQWNDTGVKGQFISKHWSISARDAGTRPVTGVLAGLNVNQWCISHTPCCPNVAYIAPFTIPFNNGVQINPGGFSIDETYGALDRIRVEQWMADPLWQAPKQCPAGGDWNEDDGTCTGQYPMRPWEEAVLAVPDGAPNLPAGCSFIDYAGYVAGRNSGAIPDINWECDLPLVGSCLATAPGNARWTTRLALEASCCAMDGIPADECAGFEP